MTPIEIEGKTSLPTVGLSDVCVVVGTQEGSVLSTKSVLDVFQRRTRKGGRDAVVFP